MSSLNKNSAIANWQMASGLKYRVKRQESALSSRTSQRAIKKIRVVQGLFLSRNSSINSQWSWPNEKWWTPVIYFSWSSSFKYFSTVQNSGEQFKFKFFFKIWITFAIHSNEFARNVSNTNGFIRISLPSGFRWLSYAGWCMYKFLYHLIYRFCFRF